MKRRCKEKHLSGEQPDSESSTGKKEEQVKDGDESVDPKRHRRTETGSGTDEPDAVFQDPAEDKPFTGIPTLPERWQQTMGTGSRDLSHPPPFISNPKKPGMFVQPLDLSAGGGHRPSFFEIPIPLLADLPPLECSDEESPAETSSSQGFFMLPESEPGADHHLKPGDFPDLLSSYPNISTPPCISDTSSALFVEESMYSLVPWLTPECPVEMTDTPEFLSEPASPVSTSTPTDSLHEFKFSVDNTVYSEGSMTFSDSDADDSSVQHHLQELDELIKLLEHSVTDTLPTDPDLPILSSDPGQSGNVLSSSPRPHSVPPLTQITRIETLKRAASLPAMTLKSSFEEFTPDITEDGIDETYRFQCSCPGLYQCSVTGLVFDMEGQGDVVYSVVPWNRRLLAQHHKKPAGPLFDIKCQQQSVSQLHLPHCEIHSTGGCHFLSVAHVKDEGVDFISPEKVTETHVVINITGFSGFGNVKDEDSPPVPVRALVLLFYRPSENPDLEHLINVLLLPKNVSLRDVLRYRKKLVGEERYIETSPHCKLHPQQVYTLSTDPEDDSALVQPTEAEFYEESYDDFYPSFQVTWETVKKHMRLFLRDANSHSVWERRVCLLSTGVKRSCGSTHLNLPPTERLLDIRSSFVDGASGPLLKTLLDKLLEKKVITDSERESAEAEPNKGDRARFVIDTVRKKGEAASSEMIEFLCEVDPFLCEHLGLI